jgi:hypothetical protein
VIGETRITEFGHPVEAVVVAVVVVHSTLGIGSETHVDTGDTSKVLESSEITATAHSADVTIPNITNGLALDSLVRRLHFSNHSTDDVVQKRRRGNLELGPRATNIDIYIGDIGAREPWQVLFNPLSATKESVFLTIPAGENDGTEGLPSSLNGLSNTADNFVDDSRTTVRVASTASDPRVSVVANYNNVVRVGAIDDTDNIPLRGGDIVLLVIEVEDNVFRRGSDVVVDALVLETKVTVPPLV